MRLAVVRLSTEDQVDEALVGVENQRGRVLAPRCTELAVSRGKVTLDSALGQEELGCNLTVRGSLNRKSENLALSVRKGKVIRAVAKDGRQHIESRGNGPYRWGERVLQLVLEHDRVGAGSHGTSGAKRSARR